MIGKFLVQVTLTYFLIQILNCVLDEFILMGLSKIFQSFHNDNTDTKQKSTLINKGLSVLNGRFLANFSNITNLTQAIVYILIGCVIIVYILTVLTNTWRFIFNKNREKSIFHLSNLYANIFLIVSIVLNCCLVAYFVVLSEKALKEYQNQTKNYQDFKNELNKLKIFNNSTIDTVSFQFNDNQNLVKINQSILKLESYFYSKYINLNISAAFSLICAILTILFIFLEIC
jgi:hypothetical protein